MLKSGTQWLISHVLLAFVSMPVGAQIFKWTDENGKVHYGDRPTSSQATTVTVKKHTSSSQPSNGTPFTNEEILEGYDDIRKRKETRNKQLDEQIAMQQQQCKESQSVLNSLNKGVWPNGKRITWDDVRIAERKEQAQSSLTKCKSKIAELKRQRGRAVPGSMMKSCPQGYTFPC